MEMIRAFLPKPSTNYRDEPTEIMPNGLPGDGQIRASRTENVIVTPVGMENEDSMRMFGALGTEEFAMMEYFRSDPQFAQFAAEIPKIEQVRAGQRLEWNFTFVVAPDVGAKGHLQDDKISKDAPIQAVSSLPQSWRDQVARRVAAMKRNPMPFPMGGGGSGPPPSE
jgi:hypothetical protein